MAMPPAPLGGAPAGPPMAGGAAGLGAPDDTAADSGSEVLVTICKNSNGSYTVYAGDEPDEGADDGSAMTDDGADGGGDMSDDDADAMGSAGGGGVGAPAGAAAGAGDMGAQPSPQGQPADSIGAALKAALDILQADKSSEGAAGSADDQFAGGFNAPKEPTARMSAVAQKY